MVLERYEPRDDREIEELKQLYDSEIAYVDEELGRVFDELKALGLYRNSLIILTSDHGEAFYEHGYWQHSETLFEEMIKVPLIVKWPGSSLTGRVSSTVNLVDIFPTLAREAGLSAIPGEGRNLRLWVEAPPTRPQRPWMVSEVSWDPDSNDQIGSSFALRLDHLKYIAWVQTELDYTGAELLEESLYDLSQDPMESTDLLSNEADARPEAELFRRELFAYLNLASELRAAQRGESVTLDEETRRHLKSLGYIQE
jgi:arylsulfatase A-like enzyme